MQHRARLPSQLTVTLELRIAMIAAMKNVLSPISEAPITPMDLPKASTNLLDTLMDPIIAEVVLFSGCKPKALVRRALDAAM